MMKSLTCKMVREHVQAQALSCISPVETELGFKVNVLVTYRGISVYMQYMEEKEGLTLYFNEGEYWLYQGRKRAWNGECPPSCAVVMRLVEDKLLLYHSICDQAMRITRDPARNARDPARDAWDAARDARYAARDAWEAAWDPARDAWDAARDAWEAAWDAARDAAWDAARDAWDDAWDASWDAWDAAWDAAKAAYKKLIALRKTLKGGGVNEVLS